MEHCNPDWSRSPQYTLQTLIRRWSKEVDNHRRGNAGRISAEGTHFRVVGFGHKHPIFRDRIGDAVVRIRGGSEESVGGGDQFEVRVFISGETLRLRTREGDLIDAMGGGVDEVEDDGVGEAVERGRAWIKRSGLVLRSAWE